MKNDSGAIEFNAVLLLFFIVAIISGSVVFAASGITYMQTDTRDFDLKAAADKILNEIIFEMQQLRLYQYDDKNNAIITGLCQKYEEYGLEINDISSGYHLDFFSDADFGDSNISGYLFKDKTGVAFSAWLKNNGLSVNKAPWREFINNEAWDSCVSYGWLHKSDTDSFAFRSISKSFASNAPDKLFPLVNNFPRININMVNPDILYPFIMRSTFKVEKPKEKADALKSKLNSGPVLHADISSILKIPINHPLMEYFGTKTSFWKIYFVMHPSLKVEAIVAAFPKKDGAIQEIEAYRLIDRSFIDD